MCDRSFSLFFLQCIFFSEHKNTQLSFFSWNGCCNNCAESFIVQRVCTCIIKVTSNDDGTCCATHHVTFVVITVCSNAMQNDYLILNPMFLHRCLGRCLTFTRKRKGKRKFRIKKRAKSDGETKTSREKGERAPVRSVVFFYLFMNTMWYA